MPDSLAILHGLRQHYPKGVFTYSLMLDPAFLGCLEGRFLAISIYGRDADLNKLDAYHDAGAIVVTYDGDFNGLVHQIDRALALSLVIDAEDTDSV